VQPGTECTDGGRTADFTAVVLKPGAGEYATAV
jgi:hypothetical protein